MAEERRRIKVILRPIRSSPSKIWEKKFVTKAVDQNSGDVLSIIIIVSILIFSNAEIDLRNFGENFL
jgi:hypothetical protein